MALTATLGEMRTRARVLTDQEESTFIEDSEITDWINQGIRQVWQLLYTHDPDRCTTTTTINTVAGTEEYTLPSDFVALRGLDYPLNGSLTRHVDIEPYEFKERNQFHVARAPIYQAPSRYRILRGNVDGSAPRLSLRPDPGTAAIRLWYVAAPTTLVDAVDTFDGIIGLDDYPVYWAAIQIRAKAEEPDSVESRGLALIEQKIKTEAGRRDRSGQKKIAQTRNRRRHPFDWPYAY